MKSVSWRFIALVGAVLILSAFARHSHAQITNIISSDAEAFFGSMSDGYQQSEPPISPPWPAVGFSLPYLPSGLPAGSVPPLYAGYLESGIPRAEYDSPFRLRLATHPAVHSNDGNDHGRTIYIFGGIGAQVGAYTRNAYVRLGNNSANLMYLNQPASATGYAYEEVQFAIDYLVGPSGLLPGNPPNLRPYLVFWQFSLPAAWPNSAPRSTTSYATVNATGVVGSFSSLGALQYQDYINSVGGPFFNTVNDTSYSTPNLLGAPGSAYGGVLELTGDMYLIRRSGTNRAAEAGPGACGSVVLLGMALLGLASMVVCQKARRHWPGVA